MDEPLSNLDAKLRVQMRAEIATPPAATSASTTIYVTHDQVEAMTMGDRVAVMRKGVLQQVAHAAGALRPPAQPLRRRLHRLARDEPRSRRRSTRERRAGRGRSAAQRLRSTTRTLAARPAPEASRTGRLVVGHPPEDLEDARSRTRTRPTAGSPANVELREALGSEMMVHLAIDAPPAMTEEVQRARRGRRHDAPRTSGPDGKHRAVVIGRFDADSKVQEGQERRSRSTPGRCTSSIRTPDSPSTTTTATARKELTHEKTVVHSCRRPGRHGARTGRLRRGRRRGRNRGRRRIDHRLLALGRIRAGGVPEGPRQVQ